MDRTAYKTVYELVVYPYVFRLWITPFLFQLLIYVTDETDDRMLLAIQEPLERA